MVWTQFFISICAFLLALVASREQISYWRGVKNLHSYFVCVRKNPHRKEPTLPAFWVTVVNKGITKQGFWCLRTDKGKNIVLGDMFTENFLKPHDVKFFFVDITSDILKNLEESKALFLVGSGGSKKKVISKKSIQKALKQYKEYLNKTS